MPGEPSTHLKINLFLDDTTLYCQSTQEIKVIREICKTYELASNSKFNWNKSEALAINAQTPNIPGFPIKWLQQGEKFRFLGLNIEHKYPINAETAWEELTTKYCEILQKTAWQLTMKGKITSNSRGLKG